MANTSNDALQHAKAKLPHEGLSKTSLTEIAHEFPSFIFDWSGTIMTQLFDVESSYSEPEKSLPLELGLDQIEDY